ncbi:hypothetical protein K435DRAFT_722775 [Dendrothele bispora CBS 962.96]|uniref:Zn(2)-C6 fungal-type domain-containing protein n=1 Tax=Dendrothele bispora (strain CBS 962.96) TaxID=1314807 RepID=A0A4S8M2J2_DENBC|nr:hypothetical protein K435DRAFT_722775 [Dendrothele bispora CBS 962.96]
MPIRKTAAPPLQRGLACLSCRKRKLKCDGKKPVCSSCLKMKRPEECEYEDRRQKSRTQKLKEKLMKLEDRIRELEGPAEGSSSGASSSSAASSPAVSLGGPFFPELDSVDPSMFDMERAAFPVWANNSGSPSSSSGSLSVPVSRSVTCSPFAQSMENSFDANSSLGHIFGLPGYSPIPEVPSQSWDLSAPLSDEQRRLLLEIFLAHRHQCWFDNDLTRFQLFADPESARPEPHPALMNAIFLLACHFGRGPHFSEMESQFLSKTLHEITVALDNSDRLVDVVQASCLLAIYLYANCRTLEAYCHSFSAARLAVGLGLHQIQLNDLEPSSSASSSKSTAPIAIAKPRTPAELRDRIAAFWQVFMVDRCWSVANGLPVALPDGEHHQGRIKTPWPEAAPELHGMLPGMSLNSESGQPVYLPSLKAKAAALYERTFRLASAAHQTDAYWNEHRSTSIALQRFNATLPFFVGFEGYKTQAPYVDVELLSIHTIANVCTIHLQRSSLEMETIQSANYIMSLIRQLNPADYEFLDPLLSACWTCVAKFYIQMLTNTAFDANTPLPAYAVEQELHLLVVAMRSLGEYFPLANEHAKKIEDERAMLLGFT